MIHLWIWALVCVRHKVYSYVISYYHKEIIGWCWCSESMKARPKLSTVKYCFKVVLICKTFLQEHFQWSMSLTKADTWKENFVLSIDLDRYYLYNCQWLANISLVYFYVGIWLWFGPMWRMFNLFDYHSASLDKMPCIKLIPGVLSECKMRSFHIR